jgi:hypothetical protein
VIPHKCSSFERSPTALPLPHLGGCHPAPRPTRSNSGDVT